MKALTFLFTDIEGSTKLAQDFPDNIYLALEKHNNVLTESIESNNGFVFKKVGDAFCSSFENAQDAVNAAIEIQNNLIKESKDEIEIKVRMGLHKGEAEYVNEDYVGYVTLSRVQRIMSLAHGGQILITQEVHDSLKYNENISFRDFGKKKLKDIIIPEHIFQIVSEELPSDFPPLKSLDARQNNLPSSVTNFIGRKKEIEEIKKELSKTRLLSLTGAGGTGKTRLAIQIAFELIDEFENGIWIIELSPITDPELIVKEISTVLKLKEIPGQDLLETLKEFLKDKNILLLFDNSEHLLTRCAPIAETLLTYCRGLKIISTSREPFNIYGEIIYRVPPMSMPDKIKNESVEILSGYESVRLFFDRAVSVNSNFKLTDKNIYAIAELCIKLDGIPLAIELASKRVNVLSAEKILERLDDRFKLLTGGTSTALPRQKTLRALIDWSYDMLNFKEQLLLQRLSIFMGGLTLEAAEEICSGDIIDEYEILDLMTSLVDKSLIIYKTEDGKSRYNMLETIKFYALEKLTGKLNDFNKHLDYFIKFSDYELQRNNGIKQFEWLQLINSEIDNIRICIQRAIENAQQEAAEIVINMFEFWQNKGYFQEGCDTMIRVLNSIEIQDVRKKAYILECLAQMQYLLGDFSKLEEYVNESLKLFEKINDKTGIIRCHNTLGLKFYVDGNFEHSLKLNEYALELSKEINSKHSKAQTLINMASSFHALGQIEKSIEVKEESLKLFRELEDEHTVAMALLHLSVSEAHIRNNVQKAQLLAEESLAISNKMDDQYFISINLTHMGSLNLMYDKKDFTNAEYLLTEAYRISKAYGYNLNLFPIRIYLGYLYLDTDRMEDAIKIYREYIDNRKKSGGEFFILEIFTGYARIHFKKNEYQKAATLFGLVDTLRNDKKHKALKNGFILNEKTKSILADELGKEKFDQHWEEGSSMSLDEGVSYVSTNDSPAI